MPAASIRTVCAVLAGILSFFPSRPSAASRPQASQRAFSLATERSGYLLGEAIHLRIESRSEVPPSLEEGRFSLAVKKDGDAERIYHPPLRLRSGPSAPAAQADSGAPYARFVRLIACDGELLFRKPGRYRLRLIAPAAPGKDAGAEAAALVLSDSLEVAFREPSAPADKKAYAILSRNPGEYALAVYLEGGDQLQEGMAIIGELAAFESSYSRLASFVLSSDWSQDFTDYHGSRSRPMDLQKALAWAQWDTSRGIYIPLRTAYRLQSGAQLLAARDPAAPGLAAVRGKLNGFLASLTPREEAWFRSFSFSYVSPPAHSR